MMTPPTAAALYKRQYRAANRERLCAQARALRAKNPEKHVAMQRDWCAKNKEKRRQYRAKARAKNPVNPEARRAYENDYRKRRFATDANYKLRFNLRRRLNLALRRQLASKTGRSLDLLGCSLESFKLYLESKFEVGMSWENYGATGWHIDHIIPLALFDLTKREHQLRAFHFSNLQPLFARDNLLKGAKLAWA